MMMEEPKNFEDIIRDKFAQRKVDFDEANWENIKKMTDAARGKTKRRKWIFVFIIGLISGIICTLPFVLLNLKNTNTEIAVNNPYAKEIVKTQISETNTQTTHPENNGFSSSQHKTGNGLENKTPEIKNEVTPSELKKKIVNTSYSQPLVS
ncbi:MAG TPA: hypothetical protein VNX68_01090, partial [Nitrosopumilaceae archaeon]|nr:hypothetical protein [Nitrosopumilaceae archaeon]